MKHTCLAALLLFALIQPWPGSAQETSAPPCASSSTEADMLACHEKEFASAQTDLEDLVKELRTNYAYDGTEHTSALDLAQEKWNAFAGAECDLLTYDSRGGTAHDVYILDCLTQIHAKRIAEIKALLDAP